MIVDAPGEMNGGGKENQWCKNQENKMNGTFIKIRSELKILSDSNNSRIYKCNYKWSIENVNLERNCWEITFYLLQNVALILMYYLIIFDFGP